MEHNYDYILYVREMEGDFMKLQKDAHCNRHKRTHTATYQTNIYQHDGAL